MTTDAIPLPSDFPFPDISRWIYFNHPSLLDRFGDLPQFTDPRTGVRYFYANEATEPEDHV